MLLLKKWTDDLELYQNYAIESSGDIFLWEFFSLQERWINSKRLVVDRIWTERDLLSLQSTKKPMVPVLFVCIQKKKKK